MEPGIKNRLERRVTESMLAVNAGSGNVRVFATPMMIALVEACAARSVEGALQPGQTTVGTEVAITHQAATPLDGVVCAQTELVEISPNGKQLTFRAEVFDQAGLIGQGIHKRAVVWKEPFEQKALERK